MTIGVSRLHFPVTTLGPGKRIGIWFQGCSIHCEGCISVDTWRFDIHKVSIEEVKNVLEGWLPNCEGITISGGEPFDQEDALSELLHFLRPFHKSILVYSGYSFHKLKKRKEILDGSIDVLISEPFDHTETQTKALLGSDNQQMHLLTELGSRDFANHIEKPINKKLDVQFDEEVLWMAGIPSNGMKSIVESARQHQIEIEHTQGSIKKKEA